MRILVTGGAGFIGSHVSDAYIALGHDVVIVDNLSTGDPKNLNPKAKFYQADIRDAEKIAEIFRVERPAVVNHHAAYISVIEAEKNPLEAKAINYQGTVNLLTQPGIKRFIFASTGGAMYSNPKKYPASESEQENPISRYGISKLSAEKAIKDYSQRNGFSHVILRYANVFGPRQYPKGESGVIAIFSQLALEGTQPTINRKETTRDYVYVGDVVNANVIALTKGNGVYNIGTGIETTNQTVFETVSAVFNWRVTPRYQGPKPGEVLRSALDATKAARELDWKPTINLEEGVRQIRNGKS